MNLKDFLDQARSHGENLKEEITAELFKSRMLQDLIQSDLVGKAVSTVFRTKDEVSRLLRDNVKQVLHMMDIPTRNEILQLERKLDQMEKTVDRVGKNVITVKSLKKMQNKRSSKNGH